jgi:hypothetical protein
MANLANLANLANISGMTCGANFASVLSTRRERPEPAAIGDAFFGDREVLGPARRREGLFANAVGGGLTELHRRAGCGGEDLPQPGASLVDGGAP